MSNIIADYANAAKNLKQAEVSIREAVENQIQCSVKVLKELNQENNSYFREYFEYRWINIELICDDIEPSIQGTLFERDHYGGDDICCGIIHLNQLVVEGKFAEFENEFRQEVLGQIEQVAKYEETKIDRQIADLTKQIEDLQKKKNGR